MKELVDFLRETADYINTNHAEFNSRVEVNTGDLLCYRVLSIEKKGGGKISLSYSDTIGPEDLNYLNASDERTPANYAKYLISLLEK